MTEALADTWHDRDLPVLRTVVRLYDETMSTVRVEQVQEATGLDGDDVQRAGKALSTAGLVEIRGAWGMPVLRFGEVSADARRLAGSWPTPETATDRLIAALTQIAEHGDTEDERSRARKILEGFAGAGQQIAVGVATAVITGQLS